MIELNSHSQLLCVVRWNVKIEYFFKKCYFSSLSRVCFKFHAVHAGKKRKRGRKFFLCLCFSCPMCCCHIFLFCIFIILSFLLLLLFLLFIQSSKEKYCKKFAYLKTHWNNILWRRRRWWKKVVWYFMNIYKTVTVTASLLNGNMFVVMESITAKIR